MLFHSAKVSLKVFQSYLKSTQGVVRYNLPSIFAIAVSGLRALNVRIVLKIETLLNQSKLAPKFTNDTATTAKSNQHHALLKYTTKPIAKSLSVVSRKNTTVKIQSK